MPAFLTLHPDQQRTDLGVTCLIGRSPEAQLRLPDNRVSRQHAIIREQGDGEYWLYDLGSANGSFINGHRVITGLRLQPGDLIKIIDHEFLFHADTPASALDDTTSDSTVPQLQTLPVLILVSDVQGYTALSQRLPAAAVAQIIGSWYRECQRIITAHGGVIDKFIGDAVLAYWTDATPATRARAARVPAEIATACRRIETEHTIALATAAARFYCGYALHAGPVVLGRIGAGAYTLIGDTVNVAFRLQTLTRTLDAPCLVSDEFLRDWPEGRPACELKGEHPVKGHSHPLRVHLLRLP